MTNNLNSTTNAQAPQPNSASGYGALKTALKAINFKALALAAFIELFVAIYYSSFCRRKSAGAADATSLRRFLHVPGRQFRTTPVPKLITADVEDLCKALAGVTIPGTDRFYADATYNRSLGALGRLLAFLSQPPWSLIPQDRLQLMIATVKDHMLPEIPRDHLSLPPAREAFVTRWAQPRINSVLTGLSSGAERATAPVPILCR